MKPTWALEYYNNSGLRVIHLDEQGNFLEEISPDESIDFRDFPKNRVRVCEVIYDTQMEDGNWVTKYLARGELGLESQDEVILALEEEEDWPEFLEWIKESFESLTEQSLHGEEARDT